MFQEITLHDFTIPLAKRRKSRRHVGPYRWTPSSPKLGRGFYQWDCGGLFVAKHGAGFDLRLNAAAAYVGRGLAQTRGYYIDSHCEGSLTPIIAMLPKGRGFLSGWTMGRGMAAAIDRTIYQDAESASYAAYSMAEHEAEKMRDSEELEELESDA